MRMNSNEDEYIDGEIEAAVNELRLVLNGFLIFVPVALRLWLDKREKN